MSALVPTAEAVGGIFDEAVEMVHQKEQAYGGSWRRRGWRGNLVRVFSKSDRLENLLWRKDLAIGNSLDESVVDTALDQIALLAMFVINYREGNEWGPRDGE